MVFVLSHDAFHSFDTILAFEVVCFFGDHGLSGLLFHSLVHSKVLLHPFGFNLVLFLLLNVHHLNLHVLAELLLPLDFLLLKDSLFGFLDLEEAKSLLGLFLNKEVLVFLLFD